MNFMGKLPILSTYTVLVAYIVLVPFYYFSEAIFHPVLVVVAKYLPLLFIAILASKYIRGNAYSSRVRIGFIIILPYFFFSLLSLLDATHQDLGLYKWFYYSISGMGVFLLSHGLLNERFSIIKLAKRISCITSISAAYGIWVYFSEIDVIWGINSSFPPLFHSDFGGWETDRPVATLGNTLYAAGVFSLILPLAYASFLDSKSKFRFVYGLSCVILLLGVIVTYSRGALITVMISSTVYIFSFRRQINWSKISYSLLGTALIIGIVIAVLPSTVRTFSAITDRVFDRFSALYDPNIFTTAGNEPYRIAQYETVYGILKEDPALGIGFGNYVVEFDRIKSASLQYIHAQAKTTENMYLMIVAETGILGLVSFVAIVIYVIFCLQKKRNNMGIESNWETAFIASIAGGLFNMATWDALNQPTMRILFWLILAFGMVLTKTDTGE